ncbi:MAG: hypothetical protein ACJ78Q_18275 [Chloroflexia bacterium]
MAFDLNAPGVHELPSREGLHLEHIQAPFELPVADHLRDNQPDDPRDSPVESPVRAVLVGAVREALTPDQALDALLAKYIRDIAQKGNFEGMLPTLVDHQPDPLNLNPIRVETGLDNRADFTAKDSLLRRVEPPQRLNRITVVNYVQTYFGLPVWKAGLSVTIQSLGGKVQITSSKSTLDPGVAPRQITNLDKTFAKIDDEQEIDNAAKPDYERKDDDDIRILGCIKKREVGRIIKHDLAPIRAGFENTGLADFFLYDVSEDSLGLGNQLKSPKEETLYTITARLVALNLGFPDWTELPEILHTGLRIFKYDADRRAADTPPDDVLHRGKPGRCQDNPPRLDLPDVIQFGLGKDKHPRDGGYYVVREFIIKLPDSTGCGDSPWRVFVEVASGQILYTRLLISLACPPYHATGSVFLTDPITSTGDTELKASAPMATLNNQATKVGLCVDAPKNGVLVLEGDFVTLETGTNLPAPPRVPSDIDAADFTYNVSTELFSAVNAFYHLESLFRMMGNMGFKVEGKLKGDDDYFDGTEYPIPVDQKFLVENSLTAQTTGNSRSNGVAGFSFGREVHSFAVGNAADRRLVIHEFCHALLLDRMHSPNFSFAHSAGDSLAVILCDPLSAAGDPEANRNNGAGADAEADKEPRYDSFPWLPEYGRRHDKRVEEGWAWNGRIDRADGSANDGYKREQILSTTMFRIYQAAGGGFRHCACEENLARQLYAAHYLAYLIIHAIGILPVKNVVPADVYDFVTALIQSDMFPRDPNGYAFAFPQLQKLEAAQRPHPPEIGGEPGGALNKIIRWGFEKQGLYPLPNTPEPVMVSSVPAVDVYIDDGRKGEYCPFMEDFWENYSVWNRTHDDGDLLKNRCHEAPIVGHPNYAYVLIKNRGYEHATGIEVRGYHCRTAVGLNWEGPQDPAWTPMDPDPFPLGPLDPQGCAIAGPFKWTPIGKEDCLLMSVSATDDLSNIDAKSNLPCATGPVPLWRLVPFDNNIALRSVVCIEVANADDLAAAFAHGRSFVARNPHDREVVIKIEVELPTMFTDKGWGVRFLSKPGAAFPLHRHKQNDVKIGLLRGEDFTAAELAAEIQKLREASPNKESLNIVVRQLIDGIVVGGITYQIFPKD